MLKNLKNAETKQIKRKINSCPLHRFSTQILFNTDLKSLRAFKWKNLSHENINYYSLTYFNDNKYFLIKFKIKTFGE